MTYLLLSREKPKENLEGASGKGSDKATIPPSKPPMGATNPNVIPKITPAGGNKGSSLYPGAAGKLASLDTTSLYGAEIEKFNEIKFPRHESIPMPRARPDFGGTGKRNELNAQHFFKKPPKARKRRGSMHHNRGRHAENEVNNSPPAFAQNLSNSNKTAHNGSPSSGGKNGGKMIDFTNFLT